MLTKLYNLFIYYFYLCVNVCFHELTVLRTCLQSAGIIKGGVPLPLALFLTFFKFFVCFCIYICACMKVRAVACGCLFFLSYGF